MCILQNLQGKITAKVIPFTVRTSYSDFFIHIITFQTMYVLIYKSEENRLDIWYTIG